MTPTQQKIIDRKNGLHDVLWQLLDDMRSGYSVCGAAKNDLVILYAELFPEEIEADRPTGWAAMIQAAQEEDK